MAVFLQEDILNELAKLHPVFTRKSLKKLVSFGDRKLVHFLNQGHTVFINGDTKNSNYDGMLFCEDVSFKKHIDSIRINKIKRLNRSRVNKFLKKHKDGK